VSEDARLTTAAASCFIAMLALGAYVARRPLTPLDVESIALRGRATPLAILFTRSGYWPALTGMTVVLGAVEFGIRGGMGFAIVLATVQLFSQAAADFAKEFFKRIRPDDWLYHKERGFSFPSGHATTAIVFFGGLLLFVWTAPLPYPAQWLLTAVLAIWTAGIPWSRMALGAHYGTDVIGGLLFGVTWFCLMLLLLRQLPIARTFI
jgi:membrane-associated phospholipid phosphatase